jgi:IS5 family transposase
VSTDGLAGFAEQAASDAERLLASAALRCATARAAALAATGERDAAAGRHRWRLRRAVDDLIKLLAASPQIAAQARQRLSGITPDGARRQVSLQDPYARPIAKGRW